MTLKDGAALSDRYGFLAGGGDVAALIAAFDWASTPLGPIARWPAAVRSSVGLILRSPVPIVSLWGEEGVMIYNDAYSVFAGGRHPRLLGSNVREGWPEVADFNDNIMKVGLAGGTLAYRDQELTLFRNGAAEQVWMDLDYSPVPDDDGSPIGVIAIVVETTAKVMAERRNDHQRQGLARIFEQAPSFMCVMEGPRHRIVAANPGYLRLVGRLEVVGQTMAEALPEAVDQGYLALLDRVYSTGQAYSAFGSKFVVQAAPGAPAHERYVDFVYQPLTDAEGAVTGVFLQGVDVTERTAAKELFQAAEKGAGIGAFEWFPEQGELSVSEEYRRIWGLPADARVTNEMLIDLVLPEDRSETGLARFRAAERNPLEHSEYRIRRTDTGEVRWLARRGERIEREPGAPPRYVGVIFDITERKEIEEALREAELRLRLALNAASIGVWEYDVTADVLTWDARVREVAEVDADIFVTWAEHFQPAVHPDDREAVNQAFTTLLEARDGDQLSLNLRIVGRRTGRVTWASLEGRRVATPAGGLRVIGTARDITPERDAMEALRQLNHTLEERVSEAIAERQVWADMFEGADDPVAAVDTDLRYIAMNRAYRDACERLFGVKPSIGDALADSLAHMPAARDASIRLWSRALGGETVEVSESGEADPEAPYYDLKFRPLSSRQGARIGAFQYARDVTQRVRGKRRLDEAENALRQAQKMEAVGQLTGGIAHDFNNMLAVVMGSLDLLGRRISDDDPRARRYVEAAKDGSRRAAALTQRLLAFSRQQPLQPEPIDANRLVAGMSELIGHSLGASIRLETVLAAGLWRTHADPNQLESAILNLAVNARDAMPDGGKLTIETQNAHFDDRYAAAHPEVSAGQYVLIAVTDTGAGMPAEVIAKAFDPFFTTKAVGKGTGLGLSQVYGFVKQSGGQVNIYSEPDQGTTLKIYLPRFFGAAPVSAETIADYSLSATDQDELILVVEDEAAVRRLSVDALAELGYRILEADGAAAALRLLDAHPAIDLLFTDVVMPDMNGKQLADEARKRRPDLKVLFTTGYTRNAVVHNGTLDRGVDLIGKPFTIEALASKVRAVLDAAPHLLADSGD